MKKFFLVLAIFFISIFSILAIYIVKLQSISVENYKLENLKRLEFSSELLKQKSERIFKWMAAISEYPDIIRFNKNGEELLKLFYHAHRHDIKGFSRVSSGMRLLYTFPYYKNAIGKDLSHQEHNRYINKFHCPVLSSPFLAVQGFRTIAALYPVFDEKHLYRGAIGVLLDFDRFVSIFFQNIANDDFSKVFLLDKRGYLLFSNLDIEGSMEKSFYELFNSQRQFINFIEEAKFKNQYTSSFRITDDNNNLLSPGTYVGSFVAFNVSDYNRWTIVSVANTKLLINRYNISLLYVFSIAFIAFLFGVVGYYLYRTILNDREKLRTELQIKTQAIIESENRLRKMFDSMEELVCLVDSDYTIKYINKSMASAIERKVLGDKCYKVYFNRNNPCPSCLINEIKHRKSIIGWRTKLPNGRTYSVNSYSIINRSGKVSILSIMYDVTEKEEIERERERILKAINAADEMIVICDSRKRITYLNEGITRITGSEIKELIGRSYPAVLFSIKRRDIYNQIERRVRQGKTWQGEIHTIRKDGKEITVHASFSPFYEKGELHGYIGLIRDITKERENEIVLRRILEKSPIIVLTLDLSYRVTSANSTFYRLTGWNEDDILEKNIFGVFVREDDREFVSAEINRADGEINKAQPIIRKDRSVIFVSWINLPIVDMNGKRKGTFCIGIDATREKELENRYLQAQKMEAIGRLASGIAHDFNNLLTAIIGNVELAQLDINAHESPIEPLREIKSAAERSEALAKRLLLLSRKDFETTLDILNCNEIIENMKSMLSRIIRENIRLELRLDDSLYKIKGIRSQIEQVFLNLIVNASDAMPEGGKITVITENINNYNEGKNYIKITVEDDGVGMNSDIIEHIFEPFFTTKARGKGTGLGLATVYGIVKNHKGDIQVKSIEGKGTRFEIFFPTISERELNEESDRKRDFLNRESDTKLEGKGKRILIVEDEESIRRILVKSLEKYGYVIDEMENGIKAMEKIRKNPSFKYDLLITDVIMPGMGGKELYDNVIKIFPDIKVIFMSGYEDGNLETLNFNSDSLKFIRKPYRLENMISSIVDMLHTEK